MYTDNGKILKAFVEARFEGSADGVPVKVTDADAEPMLMYLRER